MSPVVTVSTGTHSSEPTYLEVKAVLAFQFSASARRHYLLRSFKTLGFSLTRPCSTCKMRAISGLGTAQEPLYDRSRVADNADYGTRRNSSLPEDLDETFPSRKILFESHIVVS